MYLRDFPDVHQLNIILLCTKHCTARHDRYTISKRLVLMLKSQTTTFTNVIFNSSGLTAVVESYFSFARAAPTYVEKSGPDALSSNLAYTQNLYALADFYITPRRYVKESFVKK